MNKKRFKFRANIKDFVDCDYKNKLSKEELDWYEKFENEYYSNGVGSKNSIHRLNLPEDEFKKAVKETYDMSNAQNRDIYGIASTSKNYLKFIDDDDCFIQLENDTSTSSNRLLDPKYALEVFIREAEDEIHYDSRNVLEILHELAYECVKLGATLRPDKIRTALKRQKEKE